MQATDVEIPAQNTLEQEPTRPASVNIDKPQSEPMAPESNNPQKSLSATAVKAISRFGTFRNKKKPNEAMGDTPIQSEALVQSEAPTAPNDAPVLGDTSLALSEVTLAAPDAATDAATDTAPVVDTCCGSSYFRF